MVCPRCGNGIRAGSLVVWIVPATYQIALGVAQSEVIHRRCASGDERRQQDAKRHPKEA